MRGAGGPRALVVDGLVGAVAARLLELREEGWDLRADAGGLDNAGGVNRAELSDGGLLDAGGSNTLTSDGGLPCPRVLALFGARSGWLGGDWAKA